MLESVLQFCDYRLRFCFCLTASFMLYDQMRQFRPEVKSRNADAMFPSVRQSKEKVRSLPNYLESSKRQKLPLFRDVNSSFCCLIRQVDFPHDRSGRAGKVHELFHYEIIHNGAFVSAAENSWDVSEERRVWSTDKGVVGYVMAQSYHGFVHNLSKVNARCLLSKNRKQINNCHWFTHVKS